MTVIVGQHKQILDLVQLAKTVASSRASVLIQGEGGAGKDYFARWMHEQSTRMNRPFVVARIRGLDESDQLRLLISSVLQATGGTLVIDEIHELAPAAQAKLLGILADSEVDLENGNTPSKVDIRLLSISQKNLSDFVKQGKFRDDLFYKIQVVQLVMPSLRDRMTDLKAIAEMFIKQSAIKNQKPVSGVSNEALSVLQSYSWPGNMSELQSVLERAVVTAQGMLVQSKDIHIQRRALPVQAAKEPIMIDESKSSWAPGETLNDIERLVILQALRYHQGNRTHTAKALGISIRTLRNKLADYRRVGISV